MKPIILLTFSILFLASCTESQPSPAPVPVCTYEKILHTEVTGKSGSDESQAGGAVAGSNFGLLGCFVGGPIGCVAGAVIGAAGGAALGSLDSAIDYTITTASGTYVCQEKSCESIDGTEYEKEGDSIKLCK